MFAKVVAGAVAIVTIMARLRIHFTMRQYFSGGEILRSGICYILDRLLSILVLRYGLRLISCEHALITISCLVIFILLLEYVVVSFHPFRIAPSYALKDHELGWNTSVDVTEVADVLEKLPLNLARE